MEPQSYIYIINICIGAWVSDIDEYMSASQYYRERLSNMSSVMESLLYMRRYISIQTHNGRSTKRVAKLRLVSLRWLQLCRRKEEEE
jgi:hypothetical protein